MKYDNNHPFAKKYEPQVKIEKKRIVAAPKRSSYFVIGTSWFNAYVKPEMMEVKK